jgi:hypothetical protein
VIDSRARRSSQRSGSQSSTCDSYFHRHLEADVFNVTWLLTFYEAVSFISLVSASRVKGFADLPL